MTKEVRLSVFIDASNLWQAQKTKGCLFDYQKLIGFIKDEYNATSIAVFYYTAYPATGTRTYNLDGRHKFYLFLQKGLGFIVRKKPLKQIPVHTSAGDAVEEKGNMDVEMAIDAVNTVNKYDIAVLFTGDSDFLALVRFIRTRNKKVYIFSSRNNISSELRTGADGYTDVLKIEADIWGRQLKHRAEKE